MVYFGLPMGDSRKLNFWSLLVARDKSRLLLWTSINLSMEGHLVLLKSVMSSLSVYFLSFFKALVCIISSIKSIFNFFYGRCEDFRKNNLDQM